MSQQEEVPAKKWEKKAARKENCNLTNQQAQGAGNPPSGEKGSDNMDSYPQNEPLQSDGFTRNLLLQTPNSYGFWGEDWFQTQILSMPEMVYNKEQVIQQQNQTNMQQLAVGQKAQEFFRRRGTTFSTFQFMSVAKLLGFQQANKRAHDVLVPGYTPFWTVRPKFIVKSLIQPQQIELYSPGFSPSTEMIGAMSAQALREHKLNKIQWNNEGYGLQGITFSFGKVKNPPVNTYPEEPTQEVNIGTVSEIKFMINPISYMFRLVQINAEVTIGKSSYFLGQREEIVKLAPGEILVSAKVKLDEYELRFSLTKFKQLSFLIVNLGVRKPSNQLLEK